jgi:hypothetical protein
MTACVRDLALAYPGRYDVHIAGSCSSLWENNPHVAGIWGPAPPRGMQTYRLSYLAALRESGLRRLHLLTAFHRDLGAKMGLHVPVLRAKGDLHLDEWHRRNRPVPGRYWYLVAGGKSSIPTKIWAVGHYQRVVDLLGAEGISVVQDGATHPGHRHFDLGGVVSFVGKTTLRDVLWLIYHADGVICPVTFMMHVAAALDRPCVVIAGGREPWWWEAYTDAPDRHFGDECAPVAVPHRYLQHRGDPGCWRPAGCWKAQVRASGDGNGTTCCDAPIGDGHGPLVPACLMAITPEIVAEAVMSYMSYSCMSTKA